MIKNWAEETIVFYWFRIIMIVLMAMVMIAVVLIAMITIHCFQKLVAEMRVIFESVDKIIHLMIIESIEACEVELHSNCASKKSRFCKRCLHLLIYLNISS